MSNMIYITVINNNSITIDINLVIKIIKNKLNIIYQKIFDSDEDKICTKNIYHYNIRDYEQIIKKSNLVIDFNPKLDNYKNILYCFRNEIPVIYSDNIDNKFINNDVIFHNIDDLFYILQNIKEKINNILKINKTIKKTIGINYKIGEHDININCNIIKKFNDGLINMYSVYINKDDSYRIEDYIECIYRNMKINYLNKLYIIFTNHTDMDNSYLPPNIKNNEKVRLILLKDSTFHSVIEFANTLKDNIHCILNSDIYIINNNELNTIINNIYTTDKIAYCLSRIETDGTKYWDHPKLKKIYYSLTQDVWIYKGELDITTLNKDIKVGCIWNDIIFNKYLINSGYNIYNIGKSLPVLHLDTYIINKKYYNDPIRINNNINIHDEEYYLLPERSIIKNISIDNLVSELNINEDEIYKLKCMIMTKFININ
jgi:hypothetical protein